MRRRQMDACGSGQGPVVGSCDDGNEPLGSIKDRGFQMKSKLSLNLPRNYTHLWNRKFITMFTKACHWALSGPVELSPRSHNTIP